MSFPHDAIENLPPEPPTPTITSVSSSDISFEDIPPMSDMSSTTSPDNDLEEHPTLYIREDMIRIRVQRTLFRIPLYFLTQDSAHFIKYFEDKDLGSVVHISDDGVTSSAFANFLQVLRPPLGVTPISTLTQWTDVLHLSTKWGFPDLRAAAIRAILPLASAIHKIVLGRTYGFSDWIPQAFADILEREEDLTLEEAEMMPLKDVVAIAKGRREVMQTKKIKPRKEIEEILKDLIPSNDDAEALNIVVSDSSANPPTPVLEDVSNIPKPAQLSDKPREKQKESVATRDLSDERAKISRWLTQIKTGCSKYAPRQCLVKLMQSDCANVIPLVLDAILQRGLKAYSRQDKDRVGNLNNADEGWHTELYELNVYDQKLGLQCTTQAEEACLRLVNHWAPLSQFDLELPLDKLTSGDSWTSFVRTTKYLIYLVTGSSWSGYIVTNPSIYGTFWTALTNLYRSTPPDQKAPIIRIIKALLSEFNNTMSRTCVSVEMDAFYETLENGRDTAQVDDTQNPELATLLDEVINSRVWPSN